MQHGTISIIANQHLFDIELYEYKWLSLSQCREIAIIHAGFAHALVEPALFFERASEVICDRQRRVTTVDDYITSILNININIFGNIL